MKKLSILLLSTAFLLTNACKKKDTATVIPTTTTTTTTTTLHPYYFKFTLDGITNNYNSNQPQYMPFYAYEAGGYQGNADMNLSPSIGLRLIWPIDDTVTESDLIGLIGKTLYFNDTAIHPQLTYDKDLIASSTSWTSVDTGNTSYNVKISNVTFLKNDTTIGYYVKTYVITGTCTALMQQSSGATSVLSGGDFHFIISRRDL